MTSFLNLLMGMGLLVGWAAAGIALYGRYRTLPTFLTGPRICQLKANGCEVLFRTRNAALLGIPNSAFGLVFYFFLAVGLFLHWSFWILFAASTLAFTMSLVLVWILLRDKLECRVCWTGHICNAVIWLVLGVRLIQGLH